MEASLQGRLEKLLNAYSHHYDIRRDVTVDGGGIVADSGPELALPAPPNPGAAAGGAAPPATGLRAP